MKDLGEEVSSGWREEDVTSREGGHRREAFCLSCYLFL